MCPAGHTLNPNIESLRIFKEFVRSKMGQTAKMKKPPHAGNEVALISIPSSQVLYGGDYTKHFQPSSPSWSIEACELPKDS